MIIVRLIEMIFATLFDSLVRIIATVAHLAAVNPLATLVLVLTAATVTLIVLDTRVHGK